MKKILAAGIFLMLFSSAHAQIRVHGYLVTTSKDTLRGFILDRNDKWSVSEIQFSESESGSLTDYPIGGLSSVYLSTYDVRFVTATVEFDKKSIRSNSLEDNPIPKPATETVLLKVLAKGAISLFSYQDENGKDHFFVQKGEGKIETLKYLRYKFQDSRIVDRPYYLATLQELTSDCSTMKSKPSSYTEGAFKKYVNQYNTCKSNSDYVSTKGKLKIAFAVGGGVSFFTGALGGTSLNGNPSQQDEFNGKHGAGGYFGGLAFELVPGRATNRSRFGLQLNYHATGTMTGSAGTINPRHYEMDFQIIDVAPTYKFLFATGKDFTPYIKANPSIAFVVGGKRVRTSSVVPGGETTTRTFFEPLAPSPGFSFSAGATYKFLLFETRYQWHRIGSDHGAWVNLSNFDLVVGFRFGKK